MSLSFASLNAHCGIDHRANSYSVKAAIAALDADVVLVQENWREHGGESVAARAAADCGYGAYTELDLVADTPLADLEVVRPPAPDETGAWGLAIMSRVPWRSTTTIPLGAAPSDVVGPRYAQVVEFDLPGGVLRAVNVHLTHRLRHGPAQLRRLLTGLAGGPPTVIGGDLNMCRPVVWLARPYRPVVRGRTFPARRPLAQLDHLLAGPGVVASEPRVGPAVGTDHRPVLARLGLATA